MSAAVRTDPFASTANHKLNRPARRSSRKGAAFFGRQNSPSLFRLDAIMSKKDKRLEWPSDSEFDGLSIRSSELSDLDSDCDSLGSLARWGRAASLWAAG